jgi:hypothetical protein
MKSFTSRLGGINDDPFELEKLLRALQIETGLKRAALHVFPLTPELVDALLDDALDYLHGESVHDGAALHSVPRW